MICNNDNLIEFRLFSIKDLKEVSKLYIDSWKVSYTEWVPKEYIDEFMKDDMMDEKWTEFIKDKDSFIILAIDKSNPDKEIICGMSAVNRDKEFDETFELATLHILHSHKGKGIGKNIIKETAKHLLKYQPQIKCLYLWALPVNKPAQGLYRSLGATTLRFRTEYFCGKPLYEEALHWTDLNIIFK